jgi:hypothetical protein
MNKIIPYKKSLASSNYKYLKYPVNPQMKKFMYILLIIFAFILTAVLIFINQEKFGKAPSGERLERIKKSPNYRDVSFQNQNQTPRFTGEKKFSTFFEMMFRKKSKLSPSGKVPYVKTDLLNLDRSRDVLIWLGHSS